MKINNKNDNSISSLIKTTIVFFVSIMIYQSLSKSLLNESKIYDYYNLYIVMLFVVSALLLNKFVLFISSEIVKNIKNHKIADLIELTFMGIFIFLPMYLLNSYEEEFKFIFLLIILLTVIKSGLKYGVISSIIIDLIILTLDAFDGNKIDGVNVQFERDLIICIIFIFVAWIFGQYVTIESNNKIKTEKEMQKLSTELKEQLDQRKDIELSLLKNEVCYDMVFENSPNSIILHDDNKILYVNKSAIKLLGYEKADSLSNKSIYTYYPKDKIIATKSKYSNIINSKLSKIVREETILNSKGNFIEVRNTSSFFTYNGRPCVLTFLFDMTSEKQLETLKLDAENNLKLLNETKEFNNLITEFFTNMSHELKTPVNVIYTAIQSVNMYLENYDDKNINKCKDFLKIMKQNSFRMIRLVNNILDITKVDCGFLKLNRKNGDIVNVVEEITQSVATYVKSKNLEIVFDTNAEEKIMAFDYDKIERIMLNLLSNAYKYSNSSGKIKVNIDAREKEVVITVEDEGDGINKNKLDIIFERFGQANRSLSRENEGSGIGLYLVKSFVEMHNGKITVNSVEGKGTKFTIIIPVDYIQDENEAEKFFFETKIERINIEFSDIYSISAC